MRHAPRPGVVVQAAELDRENLGLQSEDRVSPFAQTG